MKFSLLIFLFSPFLLAQAPVKTRIVLTGCSLGVDNGKGGMETGNSNFAGYQSASEFYTCKENTLEIQGKWSEEIENGYQYRFQMGRMEYANPQFVGDPSADNKWLPSFMKWCKVPNRRLTTYELCGTK